jgi:pimeloyl-ACP methyl ester carboxylesterase
MKQTIVEHGGYRIRVRSCGPANGPHAVFLPGMGATSYTIAPQIRALRALGYATHVIDLPGFGLTPALRKGDARFGQLAELVVATVTRLGIRRAVFVGHSLGGGIALYVAMGRPQVVSGLILMAPAGLGRSLVWLYKLYCLPLIGRALLRPYAHGTRARLARFLIGSGRRNDRHFVDQLLRQDRRSAGTARSMRAIVWANQPARWRRVLLFLSPGGEQVGFTLRDSAALLRDIPTLVLWGNEDRVISVRDAEVLRRVDPNAEIHLARGVGHMLPLEVPGWTNEHIAWFDALRLRPDRRVAA